MKTTAVFVLTIWAIYLYGRSAPKPQHEGVTLRYTLTLATMTTEGAQTK